MDLVHAVDIAVVTRPLLNSVPEVVVVGAGPTGLVTALLLGAAGIRTLVIEQNASTSDEPKAVSIDDAALRTLQRARVADDIYPTLLQGTGTRYYGGRGQLLTYAHGAWPPRQGHPVKNPFQQPELERALLAAALRCRSVEVRFGTVLRSLRQDDEGVCAELDTGGSATTVRPRYLLGCDGGRSTVRALLGVEMRGLSFDQPWVVIDTVNDRHDQRYAMHHGDPRRPHVVVPGAGGFCRYEFLLLPGEATGSDPVPFAFVRELLADLRPDIDERDVIRRTVYTFHALIADRTQVGRCFLLGDAAHMMPPFAGAGLNTGVRDADNLAWKLIEVLQGRAGAELLETYDRERRPHSEAMIRLSVRLGSIVMTTSRARAGARDLAVAVANRFGWSRRYLAEMRFRPQPSVLPGFALAGAPATTSGIAGRVLPQPTVLRADGSRALLDDVLGTGFSLLGADVRPALAGGIWDVLRPRQVTVWLDDRAPARDGDWEAVADLDGMLAGALRPDRGRLVLVRPDRYAAAVFEPRAAEAVSARLATMLGRPTVTPGERDI